MGGVLEVFLSHLEALVALLVAFRALVVNAAYVVDDVKESFHRLSKFNFKGPVPHGLEVVLYLDLDQHLALGKGGVVFHLHAVVKSLG